ncbi:hypothetical protein D3C74_114630 [compost metagenome]
MALYLSFLGKGIGVCPSTNIYYPEYPKSAYLTRKQVIDLAKKGNSSKKAAPSQPNSLQFLDDLSADDLAILGSFFGVLSDMFELLSLIKIKYSNEKGPINAELYDITLLDELNRRRQR